MKALSKIFALLLVIAALVMSAGTQTAQAQSSKGKSAGTEEIAIHTSAVCSMCKTRLEEVIYNTKGVKSVSLDVDSKILTVKYNPKKVNADKLRTVVSQTGYRADEVPAIEAAYNKLPACCKAPGACSKTESSCKH